MEEGLMAMETALAGSYMVIYLFSLFYSLAVYIIQSLSLHSIADRRGISHAWLAWIPIGNLWILGSISDDYQLRAHHKLKNKRKALMWLSAGIFVAYIVFIVAVILCVFNGVDAGYNNYDDATDFMKVFGSLGLALVVMLVMCGVAVALSVIQYICYYDLFRSCEPDNAVLYLILTILTGICLPIFLLICKNKDEGFPKRPAPPVVPPPQFYNYNTDNT